MTKGLSSRLHHQLKIFSQGLDVVVVVLGQQVAMLTGPLVGTIEQSHIVEKHHRSRQH